MAANIINEIPKGLVLSGKPKSFGKYLGKIELFILTIPALLYFIIYYYVPMAGVIIAFKDYRYNKGILGSDWVGFENFKFFFTSQDAWRITRNTVGYGIIFIITGVIAAVAVALLLFEVKKKICIKFYQTSMLLPYFLSWVIVGYISYILFNPVLGVVNQLLQPLGIHQIQWYSEPKYWPFILTAFNLWKNIGMSIIMYYAALMGVDSELYEAATIDGANKWKQTLHISIPALIPIITILTILSIGTSLIRGDMGLFYQIPNDIGTLYPATDIIETYVYRGLRTGDMSITAAVGLFQSAVSLVLVLLSNMVVKKISPENSLF